MATEQVKLDLQEVIENCLASKLQEGFDANSALTIDIARQVAAEIEARAVDYTDEEIAKLKDLIGEGVDLQPIQDFMALMKELLDGDEGAEGFQIFNKLVQDTLDNKQTLISHTTSISLIQSTLATHDATLTDHENRIAALEAMDHGDIDCEECHDEMLNIIKDITSSACTAASATADSYMKVKSAITTASFADELDPIVFTADAVFDTTTSFVGVTGNVATGRRPAFALVSGNGVDQTSNRVSMLVGNDGSFKSEDVKMNFDPASNEPLTVYLIDSNQKQVGASINLTVSGGGDINLDPVLGDPLPLDPIVSDPLPLGI